MDMAYWCRWVSEGNLGQAMKYTLAECSSEVNGVYVRKRIDFMGKPCFMAVGIHPIIWKFSVGSWGECENRWMDEHIRIFDGTTITVEEGNQVGCQSEWPYLVDGET